MSAARKRRPKWIAPVIALAALVAVVGVAAFFLFGNSNSSKTRYQTAQVTKDTLVVSVSGSGNAFAATTANVVPSVSGTAYDVQFSLGQRVRKGQLLFRIKNKSLDQAYAQAHSQYKQAQQQVAQAELTLMQADQQLDQTQEQTRAPLPTDDDIQIAEQRVTAAEKGLTSAKASRTSARTSLDQADADLATRNVYAPMTGYLTTFSVSEGLSVGSGGSSTSGSSSSASGGSSSGGTTSGSSSSGSSSGSSSAPVVISDLQSMRASVSVNEAQMAGVKADAKATVTFDAVTGLSLTGQVVDVGQQGTSSSGVVTYPVVIAFDVQDKRVKLGMTCSAQIVTTVAKDVLVVPNSAVKSDSQGSYVQVVPSGQTTAQRVDVTTGAANDSYTVVKSGLTEGQAVVTSTLGATTQSTSGGGGGLNMLGGGRRGN